MSQSKQHAEVAAELSAKRLRQFLAPVDALVDEAVLGVAEDGMSVKAVDPANVCMVRSTLDDEAFAEFDGAEDQVGFHVSGLIRHLDLHEERARVRIETLPEFNKIRFTVGGYQWTTPCKETKALRHEPDLPDLDLPVSAWVDGSELRQAVVEHDLVGKHARVRYDGDGRELVVSAEGDVDDGEYPFSPPEATVDASGPADSTYALDYFKDITGPIPEGADVNLTVGKEFPLHLEYRIAPAVEVGRLAESNGTVEHILAPRIGQ